MVIPISAIPSELRPWPSSIPTSLLPISSHHRTSLDLQVSNVDLPSTRRSLTGTSDPGCVKDERSYGSPDDSGGDHEAVHRGSRPGKSMLLPMNFDPLRTVSPACRLISAASINGPIFGQAPTKLTICATPLSGLVQFCNKAHTISCSGGGG